MLNISACCIICFIYVQTCTIMFMQDYRAMKKTMYECTVLMCGEKYLKKYKTKGKYQWGNQIERRHRMHTKEGEIHIGRKKKK